MEIIVKKFEELTALELYEILKFRAEVFVVEQNCAYLDIDGVDKVAYHVYIQDNGEIVAYLRVIDKGNRLDEVSVGRVITKYRRKGLGSAVMKAGIAVAKEKFNATKIKVGAQEYAVPFYQSVGFRLIENSNYLEDGIPHVYMIYEN